jgi:hypothetical protein
VTVVRIQNHPAVLVHERRTKESKDTEGWTEFVISGGHRYRIMFGVTGAKITPEVQKKADAMWETVKQNLHLKKK